MDALNALKAAEMADREGRHAEAMGLAEFRDRLDDPQRAEEIVASASFL